VRRLVAVSNRLTLPRRAAVPGGRALGLIAAVQARGGLWFGWSGDITAWHTRFVQSLLAATGGSTEGPVGHTQGDDEQERAERGAELPAVE
jgi:hypothetical protein